MKHLESTQIDKLAKILWNYNKLSQKLTKADAIIAMGSMDLRVAERAAELWHDELGPIVIASGGFGRLTGKQSSESEAHKFSKVLYEKGVSKDKIIIEDKSTNSAENLKFSLQLLNDNQLPYSSIIIVTKPYMERRAYATVKKQSPEIEVQVASPEISYERYPSKGITKELMINIMVGDTQRIQVYPSRGFSIEQEIPNQVIDAMKQLVDLGYNQQLVS
jgi:uncharacterized SAM-binding protein YcdF (DUF218 family)